MGTQASKGLKSTPDWMTGTKFLAQAGTQFDLRKIDFMKRRSEAMYSSMTC